MAKVDIARTALLVDIFHHVMSCHDRHLGFDRTGNSGIRSAEPKTLP